MKRMTTYAIIIVNIIIFSFLHDTMIAWAEEKTSQNQYNPKKVNVVIQDDGSYIIENIHVVGELFKNLLAYEVARREKPIVVITNKGNSEQQAMTAVMDYATKLDISRIALTPSNSDNNADKIESTDEQITKKDEFSTLMAFQSDDIKPQGVCPRMDPNPVDVKIISENEYDVEGSTVTSEGLHAAIEEKLTTLDKTSVLIHSTHQMKQKEVDIVSREARNAGARSLGLIMSGE